MGVHLIAKGFLNAYDVAVIVSGDSDYIPALEILNTIRENNCCCGCKWAKYD